MVHELVVETVAAQRIDARGRNERALRLSRHRPADAVDDRPQRVLGVCCEVERGRVRRRNAKLIEPVEQDVAIRVEQLALHSRETVEFPRVLDIAQDPGRPVHATRNFHLHLHQFGLGAELADILDFVRVDRVAVHQTRDVEIAGCPLFSRTLKAFGTAGRSGHDDQFALPLLDCECRGADRVRIEDIQIAEPRRLERIFVDRSGELDGCEGILMEYVQAGHY